LLSAWSLIVLLSWAVFPWIINAWLDSPLDRQGPLFFILALIASSRLSFREQPATAYWLPILLGLLLYLGGIAADINLAMAIGLVLIVHGLLMLWGCSFPQALAVSGLLLLSLPTISFLLGKILQDLTGTGYAVGVVVKWPLALALWMAMRSLWPAAGLLLAAPLIAWFAQLTTVGIPVPATAGRWLGAAPWASLLALAAGLSWMWLTKNAFERECHGPQTF